MARPHLARAVELSDDPRFRESYDQIAEKLGQVREAELAWALALERAEADPVEAESLFEEAYAACPDHVPTLVDYGEFLLQRGQLEEAHGYLEKAVQLDPCEERAARLLAELKVAPPEPSSVEEESPPREEESAGQSQTEKESADG